MNQSKKPSEKKPTVDSGRQQLIQAFLILATIATIAWFGLMVYFSEPIPAEAVQ